MASKYLRELAMRALNDYWRRRVPELAAHGRLSRKTPSGSAPTSPRRRSEAAHRRSSVVADEISGQWSVGEGEAVSGATFLYLL